MLRSQGSRQNAAFPTFDWPLSLALHNGNMLVNYVDHDNSAGIEDYQCHPHSYDGHNGTDITLFNFRLMDRGIEILAAAEGTVVEIERSQPDRNTGPPYPGDANRVIVQHLDGSYAWYYHMQKNSLTVDVGDMVQRGQVLGLVGSSGFSTDAHLHFELRDSQGQVRDPWHGSCQPLPSLWVQQEPYVGDAPIRVYDMGVFTANSVGGNIDNFPFDLFKERITQPVVFSVNEPFLALWLQLQSQQGDSYEVRFLKPDGSLFRSISATLSQKYSNAWFYWYWDFAGQASAADFGHWTAQVLTDGSVAMAVRFEVAQETVYAPRFWPIAGKSILFDGDSYSDTLRVSPLGGPVSYKLLNPPDFVSLVQDSIVRFETVTHLDFDFLYFQAVATEGQGYTDTVYYHVVNLLGQPDITINPMAHDFGNVFVDSVVQYFYSHQCRRCKLARRDSVA